MSAPYPQGYYASPPHYTQSAPELHPAPHYTQPIPQPGIPLVPQSNYPPPHAPENPKPTDGHNQNINITIANPLTPTVPVANAQPLQSAPVHTIVGSSFQDTPVTATCPNCNQRIITRLQYSVGLFSWILFAVFMFFGCWLGCCIIPFVMDRCKDVDHYCPSCNYLLHKYKRM
ncbi:lipopolysaccharide-induced tumor necrosis factor-alpha factor homolog isoform X3 [Xenopus tropicalis]|uniref:Lipopolysaccharide-induced tumor necrosis factor-alpha factor homolog n=1 Tax=Xenopus tropicalis TaxID=8364 RepID=A0A6I8SWC0_XENTR|nr:lipopolysaccharide-induced tumor necrosis factor-alpha factor homolog isoform X3 [Xenopus tropicalis]|eukprot:XP_004918000.1 PREDICTED: lipopolysaccharide-induced tumor necrosis factor-alpha factor homolog isoform X2 [Xenopus tropicalis]